jgi:hypothetical protein
MSKRARWIVGGGAVVVLGVALAVLGRRHSTTPIRTTSLGRLVSPPVMAPANTHVRVEIVNATRTRGLARRATRVLRDRGFDVVSYTTSSVTQDSTVVLDRSNHLEWARLVGQALGGARVEARPDTSRYVDVTVVLGTSWRPPPQPFSP